MIYVTVTAFQQNPDKSCAAVALAHYLDVPYAEARELITAYAGYTPHSGTPLSKLHALLTSMGLVFVKKTLRLTATKSDPTLRLPERCVLLFGHHVAAYEQGIIYDTFHTLSTRGCKQIHGYWAEPSAA